MRLKRIFKFADYFFLKTKNLLLRRKPILFKAMDDGPASTLIINLI